METSLNTPVIQQIESTFAPKLVYRFVDSSVPPEYHRSYTITVKAGGVELTVDSYGNILAEYTLPISEKGFQNLLTELQQIEIFSIEPGEERGCSGGITDRFDILLNDVIINGYVYHCAGEKYGNLSGNTDDAARLFKALVPGLMRKIRI